TSILRSESVVCSATLPAFYFQDYTRRRLEDGTEACDPRGIAVWKARFTPRMAGPHSFRIRVQDREGNRYESPLRPFMVEDAPFRGYVRVDPKDPKYLSFDDGSFFYPIGMVIRSPWDSRCGYQYEYEPQPGLETYAYDMYFRRMKESGMNFARVWMASWWVALEWSRGYRQDYEGLGRYSLMNAWRLDYIIRQGEKMGIYFDLTLNNHGQFTIDCDPEWPDNPNNIEHGGNLRMPNEFWKNPVARQYVQKRLRYVVARWGYSPAIAWFLLCNEVNLVYGYDSNSIRSWHEFVSSYLKSADPYKHLCSAHVTNGGFDPNVGGQPMMDIKQSNGYSADMVGALRTLWEQLGPYKLPAYVNEFGYGWNSPDYMKYNLHGGLWASNMLPFCGPALYWYWLYVHGSDQYSQYAALAAFTQGEDYRGLNLKPSPGVAVDHSDKQIEAIALQNDERAYLWIYDRSLYRQGLGGPATIKDFPATAFHVEGLKPGKYRVEFWDPWKGVELYSTRMEQDHAGGKMDLKTPPFSRDLACKIKRLKD
ncbi:MAG: hypothetical protein NTX50_01605, partial [Candidatus Sumerlaeota bacterium]|nr:hypothetical protein [Candidatus Sumerlaeota bacterium]